MVCILRRQAYSVRATFAFDSAEFPYRCPNHNPLFLLLWIETVDSDIPVVVKDHFPRANVAEITGQKRASLHSYFASDVHAHQRAWGVIIFPTGGGIESQIHGTDKSVKPILGTELDSGDGLVGENRVGRISEAAPVSEDQIAVVAENERRGIGSRGSVFEGGTVEKKLAFGSDDERSGGIERRTGIHRPYDGVSGDVGEPNGEGEEIWL